MSAKVVAVYSLKGGVGKTTLAVNLAWATASLSARRTLLWDLDAQAAASFILGHDGGGSRARAALLKEIDPATLIERTAIDRLDLLPADASLRSLDVDFRALDKKKRVARLADAVGRDYDRVLIDCPPGLTDTTDQILRAADLVVVPVIPSALAQRAFDTVAAHVGGRGGPKVPLLPVFSMVDRRRALHRQALAAQPDWPVVPMASALEAVTEHRAPVGLLVGRTTPTVQAIADVWREVERGLATLG